MDVNQRPSANVHCMAQPQEHYCYYNTVIRFLNLMMSQTRINKDVYLHSAKTNARVFTLEAWSRQTVNNLILATYLFNI